MIHVRTFAAVGALLLWAVCAVAAAADALTYRVVARYPHDPDAFTQGLLYHQGVLYESTGLYGESTVRRVDLATGNVIASTKLPPRAFGEGLALWNDRLIQLTWREQTAFVFNLETLEFVGQHEYHTEGWGLTFDGTNLLLSDGSDTLYFHSPEDFSVVRRVQVKDGEKPVTRLNELEYINGQVWANVWQQDRIAVIDPNSGGVIAWLDLQGLHPKSQRKSSEDVLNGIAFNPDNGRLLVTGKKWPVLFELEVGGLEPGNQNAASGTVPEPRR